MTRGEQFRHCSNCQNIGYDEKVKLMCLISRDTASFTGTCANYKKLPERVYRVPSVKEPKQNRFNFSKYLNSSMLKVSGVVVIFIAFLSMNSQSAIIAALIAFGIGIYLAIYFMKILKKSHL